MQCSQCDPSIHWVLKCGSDIRRIPSSSNNSSIIVIRILPLIDIASGLLSSPVWVPHQHRKVYISKTGPTKSPSVVGNLQKTPKILASQIPAFCGLLALNQSWSESPTELGGSLRSPSKGNQLPCCEDTQAALWRGPCGRTEASCQHPALPCRPPE